MALFSSRVSTPFGYLSRVLVTFMVMARRAKKISGPFKDFPKGKQLLAQGIFTPFGVQCKVFLQGFVQSVTKIRPQGIFTPSGFQ